jgi:hypothetical protein
VLYADSPDLEEYQTPAAAARPSSVTDRSLAREHERVRRELEAARAELHAMKLQQAKQAAAESAAPLGWLRDAETLASACIKSLEPANPYKHLSTLLSS